MPKSSSHSKTDSNGETNSSCRYQRNIAEKQRRDKLNHHINELAAVVPYVAQSSKRLDKTSILRLAAAHIRMHKNLIQGQKKHFRIQSWRPTFIRIEQIKDLLEDVGGFIFISSRDGKVMYMSSSVERFLGHQNIDVIGYSFLNFVHPTDTEMVNNYFLTLTEAIDKGETMARCCFHCRLREKSQPRSEVVSYQVFQVTLQMNCHQEHKECDQTLSSISLVKGFAQLVQSSPLSQMSLRNSIADEYVTCHDTMGRIIQVDQNISTITGHLPEEVLGKSAYDYILPEDLSVTAFAQRLMLTNSNGRGLAIYRLRTISGSSVYLMSSGFLQFDSKTGQISHFVCVNRLLSKEIGAQELKKFQLRYSSHQESVTEMASPPESPCSPTSYESSSTPTTTEQLSSFDDNLSPLLTHSTTNSPVFVETNGLRISTVDSDFENNSVDTHSQELLSIKKTVIPFGENASSNVSEESLFFNDLFDRCAYSDHMLDGIQESLLSPVHVVPNSHDSFH